ncbi:MAG: aldo/keto reductase [Oscillospiraceae bacterium]|nr:aldo/keto reductase [Oscillospiraceae bacterium]
MIKLNDELSLSEIVQGFWRLDSWNYTTDDLVKFMNDCIDLGVTSFDTAEIYGGSEEKMGYALKDSSIQRDKIQIVTKTGIVAGNGERMSYYDTRYDHIIEACKRSLKKLNLEYIDLYLIHREDPCIDPYEVACAFEDLKKDGLIKSAGVSNFDPFKLDALRKCYKHDIVTNQIEINPICFEHFDSGMVDYLTCNKIHPMIWSPLAGGRLFTNNDVKCERVRKVLDKLSKKYEVGPETIVFAWLLYHPVKAIPLSGSKQIVRLKNSLKAFEIKLSHDEWYEIYTASGQKALR